MKRFLQVSTTLVLSAVLAQFAAAESKAPHHSKQAVLATTAVTDEPAYDAPASAESEAAEEFTATEDEAVAPVVVSSRKSKQQPTPGKPASEAARKPASKIVAQDEDALPKTGKLASYHAQPEVPPPAPGPFQDGPPLPPADDEAKSPFIDEPGSAPPPAGMGLGCNPGCNCNCNDCQPTWGCSDCCNSCDLCSGCGDVCCNRPTRNFARIEYLMWWGRGRTLPPLVTTSINGTPMDDAGVLGEMTTTVLFGGNDIGQDWRSGGRVTLSRTLDEAGAWLAVGRFYGLDDSEDSFHAESAAGDPILARPFFNALLLQQDALLVGFPGVSTNGVIDVQAKSDMLGGEAYLRHLLVGDQDLTIDVLGGYQFARLDDSLVIQNSELVLLDPQGIFLPNTQIAIRDSFRTRNEFHGGVIGLAADVYRGPWKLELLGKLGFGNQRQTVSINGNTQITPNVGPVTNDPQGLLARQTNSGTFTQDVFTIIPEVNFTLGYQVNNWNFSIGYSFMYFKDVAWAGDQIDTRVNLSNPLVGDQLPAFAFRNTDFWLQGLSFGAGYSF